MPGPTSSSRPPRDKKKTLQDQKEYQRRVADALKNHDDPLATYDKFVRWTLDNFSKSDPQSNLIPLLNEVTSTFEDDKIYKGDLRYLKIWLLYIRMIPASDGLDVFQRLVEKEIGTEYVTLWQGYANALEAANRLEDAEEVYKKGVSRKIRRVEKLEQAFEEFKARVSALPSSSSSSHGVNRPSSSADSKKANPTPHTEYTNALASAESRYAIMLAPPPPGKRPERLRFNFDLLFNDGVEYSGPEVRAKSQGLFGKRWPPYPPDHPSPAHTGRHHGNTTTTGGRRKSVMMGEPTVTINTKEALADVFGMYNSPEKTRKLAGVRMRGFEPSTPAAPIPSKLSLVKPAAESGQTPASFRPTSENRTPAPTFQPFREENTPAPHSAKTPTPAFRPFVDENSTPAASKLGSKTPLVTPRMAFSTKETPLPSKQQAIEEEPPEFTPVFTPASTKPQPFSVCQDPDPAPVSNRQSSSLPPSANSSVFRPPTFTPAFKPFVDENAKTPMSSVFSPPSTEKENLFSFSSLQSSQNGGEFKPMQTFMPFKDAGGHDSEEDRMPDADAQSTTTEDSASTNPSWVESRQTVAIIEDYQDDFDDDDENAFQTYDDVVAHLPPEQSEALEDEGDSFDDHAVVPFGGRFGQFNVMTPITERTFEFTESARMADLDFDNDQEEEHTFPQKRLRISHNEDTASPHGKSSGLTLAETLDLHAHFNPPNPCNPIDDGIIDTLLSLVPADDHVHDLMSNDANLLNQLNKFGNKRAGSSVFPLELGSKAFEVLEKLGEGGFGSVFKASEQPDDEDFDVDEDEELHLAIKVVAPSGPWEYHALRRLHAELPQRLHPSIVRPHELYLYRDESFLIMDYCPQGTLLNVVNNAGPAGVASQGACLDELLVMFFTIELLRLMEGMHGAGFIHGDLKIDNCMVRLEDVPGGNSAWSADYDPSGGGGWSAKGLKLIDFGRSIDTKLFPTGQMFIADWKTDDRDCVEIRENRPWTFETDYYGLAGIIYCMLFGRYMQSTVVVSAPDTGRLKVATPLKRYWQGQIWTSLFDHLLNPKQVRPDASLPINSELASIRENMEGWLKANCNRAGGTLKGLLKKVQIAVE